MATAELWTCWLGQVEYREALALQERARAARLNGDIPDTLLLLEHPPVLTKTKRVTQKDLPMGEPWYLSMGIDIVEVNRGGHVTYHGPGQLTGYTIMETRDVAGFVHTMEDALVAALADEGISARTRADEGAAYAGVWVEHRKIGSVGVHIHKGVTIHGFAVNVVNDMQPFDYLVACGLPEVQMTSVYKELGPRCNGLDCFRKRAAHRFAEAHGLKQRLITPARLERALQGVYSPA